MTYLQRAMVALQATNSTDYYSYRVFDAIEQAIRFSQFDTDSMGAYYEHVAAETAVRAAQWALRVHHDLEVVPFKAYQLPDGQIVMCDRSATKSAEIIDFTLADGRIVLAQTPDRKDEV